MLQRRIASAAPAGVFRRRGRHGDGDEDVHGEPLRLRHRPAGLAGRAGIRGQLPLGIRRRARLPAEAVPQGQAPAVGLGHPHRLVAGPRPREPRRHARRDDRDLRLAGVEPARREGAHPDPAPRAGLAALAVPARRAGRARLHGQDRAAGAEHRRQVLRRHAGHGRGAPRRGVLAPAAREVRARLPDQPVPEEPDRGHAARLALGHDLPRHAGADRGRGARGVRAHPRLRPQPARRSR